MSGDERPVAYTALEKGMPVVLASGQRFGTIQRVLEDTKAGIFLGLVVTTRRGSKFVARDIIERMTAREVRCILADEPQVGALPDAPASARLRSPRRHP